MKFLQRLAAAAALLFAGVGLAQAATIPISLNVAGGPDGFWTYSTSFNLPTGWTGASLQITRFEADDRAVLRLNGADVASTGVSGPGIGLMQLTSGGPNDPYTFLYGSRIGFTAFPAITSGFVTGLNSLDFIINDTFRGILGNTVAVSGPTDFQFDATVSYNVVSSGVPEPATWAMMLIGFAGLGYAARRRKLAVA